ncbi:MAG TPA: ACP phosphodiesterase [Burkholderiales bacterium]|nr:ACP phosphodiesterase [Burkholderiales bacterium]
MNYLGHLYLSPPDEDALLGSLMGDFVKGPVAGRYPPSIERAIVLHRRLDTFTDTHAAVRLSRSRISAARRRYAGIMIDVFYDHFLARSWTEFHAQPLEVFCARIYEMLERREAELPERLRRVAPNMARWNWFGSYAEVESIYGTLERIGQRLKRENPLYNAADELLQNYAALEADFRAFLPDSRAWSRQLAAQAAPA